MKDIKITEIIERRFYTQSYINKDIYPEDLQEVNWILNL